MKRQRLSAQTWIEAGLSELISAGPAALAAEPLARKLGATKGSFYWHFKGVPDFHAAVIKHWQADAFADVLQALEDRCGPELRLRRFGKNVLARRQDPAIRAWARTDKSVAKAVTQVDAERLKYVISLLHSLGIRNADFAHASLAMFVGLPAISNKTKAARTFESMIDLVLALK